jgi:hypothetical protein
MITPLVDTGGDLHPDRLKSYYLRPALEVKLAVQCIRTGLSLDSPISSLGRQCASLNIVVEVCLEKLFSQIHFDLGVPHRGQYLDTSIQITGHTVGAAREDLGSAGILKIVKSAVFEQLSHYAADPYIVGQARNAGPECTDSPDYQVDLHAGI